jgi:hypothetical protein
MYNRLPRAVLPRGILLCHIFLGEPAFSNHNGAKGQIFRKGPFARHGFGDFGYSRVYTPDDLEGRLAWEIALTR